MSHRLDGRVVVWFSCGAASACAAWLGVHKYPEAEVVYCDLRKDEHPDNQRFLEDVQRWISRTVTIISSKKFRDVDDVFEHERYMSGHAGAACTRAMKAVPRRDYQRANDLHIFGLCAEEGKRIVKFEKNNPDLEIEWILRDAGWTHARCLSEIAQAGIEIPVMYKQGFPHNNCIGCVKSQSPTYWNRVRKFYPGVFEKRAMRSREIGCKLIKIGNVRSYLDELPVDLEGEFPEPDIECGVVCVGGAREDRN